MNISKALKKKKKLTTEIEKLKHIFRQNNSINSENSFKYDIKETLSKLEEKTSELISLKCAIAKANQGINETIYLIAELKGKVQLLKSTPSMEGKNHNSYSSIITENKVVFDEIALNNMIEELENKIDDLQDKIDGYNHNTEI